MHNLEQLREAPQGYRVGLQRRQRQNPYDSIREAEARGEGQACPVGIPGAEQAAVPHTRVQEVPGKQAGVRGFVVPSEEQER